MSNSMESAGIVAGKTAVYGGAATAVASGMSLSEMGIVVGAVVGLLGLIFGQYWAWRRDERQRAEVIERKAERELRMSLMRASGRPIYHQDTDLGKLEAEQ
ncbi:holin [Comamonas sp. B21-038]|uniref:holin n=2 Tax=unclassified Comamonas TaxID=2638500 RepID=UPI001EFAFD89|nr:holin [Comamonas sp. B21-038]ULR87369.1 hypothetical protein MJ205_12930 [Comamonas sp. B21-038]